MTADVDVERLGHGLGSLCRRPPTPCCIDHRMYPDIIDAVIASVEPQASLVLRATSREFRDRVDNELWRHIYLSPSHTGLGISVAAAAGNMPLRIRHCGHSMHEGHCTDPNPCANEVYPALLKYARVVSIRGPADSYIGSLNWFSAKLTQIETLRLLPPMPRPGLFTIWPDTIRGARTVVVFTTMNRGSRRFLENSPPNDAPPATLFTPPSAPVPPIPSSASRCVINVTFHPDDPFIAHARVAPVAFGFHLKELVVIFHRADPVDVTPDLGTPSYPPLRRPVFALVYPIIRSMLENPKIHVTFVGATQLGNHALGLPADLPATDMTETLLENAAEIFLTQGMGFDQRNPTKTLQIMTLEEYRAAVDDDFQFDLETRE